MSEASDQPGPRLLADGEPAAFEILNQEQGRPLLLACDHASNRVPAALDDLGLPETSLQRHIAIDIGAAEVTRYLSHMLGATAVLCNYSRAW